jgi:hypothetical protein
MMQRRQLWLLTLSIIVCSALVALMQRQSGRVGTQPALGEEAVRANLATVAAATGFPDGQSAGVATPQRLLAMDALVYAYLQRGQERAAKLVLDELQTTPPVEVEDLAGAYAVAAIPARYALERSRWAEAAALARQPLPQGVTLFPQAEAVTVFSQALGAARSGNPEHARQALERLEALHHALVITRQEEWAVQVEIQQRVVEAWIARAEHRHEDALQLMRRPSSWRLHTTGRPSCRGLSPLRASSWRNCSSNVVICSKHNRSLRPHFSWSLSA